MYKMVETKEKYSKVESIHSLTILADQTDWKGSSSDSLHNNQLHNIQREENDDICDSQGESW